MVVKAPTPQQQLSVLAAQMQMTASTFSGPLPSPDILRQYNDLLPGLAERLTAAFEAQIQHRMHLEKSVVEADIDRSRKGLWVGACVAVLSIVAGFVAVLMGHEAVGGTIATASVVSLAAVFVYGTAIRKQEREQKAQMLKGPAR